MKIFWFELGIVRMVQTVQPPEKSLLLLYDQKVSCYNIHKYRTYILTGRYLIYFGELHDQC